MKKQLTLLGVAIALRATLVHGQPGIVIKNENFISKSFQSENLIQFSESGGGWALQFQTGATWIHDKEELIVPAFVGVKYLMSFHDYKTVLRFSLGAGCYALPFESKYAPALRLDAYYDNPYMEIECFISPYLLENSWTGAGSGYWKSSEHIALGSSLRYEENIAVGPSIAWMAHDEKILFFGGYLFEVATDEALEHPPTGLVLIGFRCKNMQQF